VNIASQVADRMTSEKRKSWHQRRGAYEIDYTDFPDLLMIAESKPDVFFPVLLGEQEWFRQFFREVVPSRNVVCHMNPLSSLNGEHVSLKLKQWQEHLRNRQPEIAAAMTPAVAVSAAS
jgi:hypothetical protein